MKGFRNTLTIACMTTMLGTAPLVVAQTTEPAPAGEGVIASIEATATVTKVDYKTREVTVRTSDGEERSFVASDQVKNLAQVAKGDVITVTYSEAFVYEVHKGGAAVEPQTAVAGIAAEPGTKPAGAIARQTTATVRITAIDPKVPSVTFEGPGGNTRTLKVMRPEKLKDVNVGDTVQITYTEALAIKVAEAPKK